MFYSSARKNENNREKVQNSLRERHGMCSVWIFIKWSFNHENALFIHFTWNFPKNSTLKKRLELHFKCNSLVITWIVFHTVLYFLKSFRPYVHKVFELKIRRLFLMARWERVEKRNRPLLAFCFQISNAPWLWSYDIRFKYVLEEHTKATVSNRKTNVRRATKANKVIRCHFEALWIHFGVINRIEAKIIKCSPAGA